MTRYTIDGIKRKLDQSEKKFMEQVSTIIETLLVNVFKQYSETFSDFK